MLGQRGKSRVCLMKMNCGRRKLAGKKFEKQNLRFNPNKKDSSRISFELNEKRLRKSVKVNIFTCVVSETPPSPFFLSAPKEIRFRNANKISDRAILLIWAIGDEARRKMEKLEKKCPVRNNKLPFSRCFASRERKRFSGRHS